MEKEIFTAIGILLTLLGYSAYFISIFKGNTTPHPFSWFIWATLTAIGFFAKLDDNGGLGSYITGLSAFISYIIVIIGLLKRQAIVITKSDWLTFIAAMFAIPLWYITETPLWSVILITVIDALGFYPTFRKTWNKPGEELPFHYFTAGLKFVFAIMALNNYSVITVLYPLSLVIMNFVFIVFLYYRKMVLKNV